MSLKILSKICLLFFLFIVVNYFYIGVVNNPSEGDSLGYHIPIAKSFFDGTIFTPEKIVGSPFLKFSPASSEGILSLFYFLHIPPGLYNVVGVVFLFASLYYLARKFEFDKNVSVIFATSVSTLNGIVRWLDTQIIDIYLAAFFVMALSLLQKPEKKLSYFLKLGFFIGMLIGSKYTGLLFAGVLLIVYAKRIIKVLTIKNFLFFLIPVFLFGGIWYLRNYLTMGNPMYPQGFLFFKDHGFKILNTQVITVMNSSLYGLMGTINAFISEYMIWVLSIPTVIYFAYKKTRILFPLILVGIINFIIYLFLPSDNYDYIMVSVMRYSYPALIPFILGLFLIARQFKKEEYLGLITISNIFFVSFPLMYNPKLVFIFVPLALIVMKWNQK